MTSVVIVAAGSSRRMGFDKLAADLSGKPVLLRSLEAFQNCTDIDEIVVVTSSEREASIREFSEGISKLTQIVEGGAERHLSVWNGIQATNPESDIVAIHDGARPLVDAGAISQCVEVARAAGAATLAHPITDTIKKADESGIVSGEVSRDGLWAMETPQIFRRELIAKAYEKVIAENLLVTDEVSAIQIIGEPVQLVENQSPNPKITFPSDIALAESLLRSS